MCGKDVDEHLDEHREERNVPFEGVKIRICRYFKRGVCSKGQFCKFKHESQEQLRNRTPQCLKGQGCL